MVLTQTGSKNAYLKWWLPQIVRSAVSMCWEQNRHIWLAISTHLLEMVLHRSYAN